MTNKPMLSVEREQILAVCNVVAVAEKLEKEAFAKGVSHVDVAAFRSLRYALDHLTSVSAVELRALLDKPVFESQYAGMNQQQAQAVSDGVDEILHGKPAAQHQGEPVVIVELVENKTYGGMHIAKWDNPGGLKEGSHKLYAEQPAPVAVITDDYCIMPRRLTAENGAKALLLGEFKLEVIQGCPECAELEEPDEYCSICDGEGEYGQQHMIPWDQIKFIYSEAVKGLAKPNEMKS